MGVGCYLEGYFQASSYFGIKNDKDKAFINEFQNWLLLKNPAIAVFPVRRFEHVLMIAASNDTYRAFDDFFKNLDLYLAETRLSP